MTSGLVANVESNIAMQGAAMAQAGGGFTSPAIGRTHAELYLGVRRRRRRLATLRRRRRSIPPRAVAARSPSQSRLYTLTRSRNTIKYSHIHFTE